MIVVPRIRTSKTEAEAARALVSVFGEVMGRPLARQEAELLLAQMWVETGRGVSINNNNPGNLSASPRFTGQVWRPPWFEKPGPETTPRNRMLHAEMLANRAPQAFRAYATYEAGLADHIKHLRGTFPLILRAVETGDAFELAKAIYNSRYCRDEACKPEKSVIGLKSLQRQFQERGTFAALPLASMPPPPCPGE